MKKQSQRGFTLIEAIVALVLISSVGFALFGWVNQNIVSLHRINESNEKSRAVANILEFMHKVNPMVVPEERASFGSYDIRWKAELASEIRDAVANPQGIGLHQLALYRTHVFVEKEQGVPWFDFELRQVGYKKVRTLPMGL